MRFDIHVFFMCMHVAEDGHVSCAGTSLIYEHAYIPRFLYVGVYLCIYRVHTPTHMYVGICIYIYYIYIEYIYIYRYYVHMYTYVCMYNILGPGAC